MRAESQSGAAGEVARETDLIERVPRPKGGHSVLYEAIDHSSRQNYVVKAAMRGHVPLTFEGGVVRSQRLFPRYCEHMFVSPQVAQRVGIESLRQGDLVREYVAAGIIGMLPMSAAFSTVELLQMDDSEKIGLRSPLILGFQDLLTEFRGLQLEFQGGEAPQAMKIALSHRYGGIAGFSDISRIASQAGTDPEGIFALHRLEAQYQINRLLTQTALTRELLGAQVARIAGVEMLLGSWEWLYHAHLGYVQSADDAVTMHKVDHGKSFFLKPDSLGVMLRYMTEFFDIMYPREMSPDVRTLCGVLGAIRVLDQEALRTVVHSRIEDLHRAGINFKSVVQAPMYTSQRGVGDTRPAKKVVEDYMVSVLVNNQTMLSTLYDMIDLAMTSFPGRASESEDGARTRRPSVRLTMLSDWHHIIRAIPRSEQSAVQRLQEGVRKASSSGDLGYIKLA